jgi:TolB-like protein/Tfp pilus assembly protein PilF
MVERPFPAYEGDEPYIFVSYAHDDAGLVYAEITQLKEAGFHIWYDEGISPGSEWTEALGNAINHCTQFLYYVSPVSAASRNCRDELLFARELGKPMIALYLEETELPAGLRLSLGSIQALLKYEMAEEDYWRKLHAALKKDGVLPKPAEAEARTTYRAGQQRIRSLVVLPFVNLSSDPEQEYFVDGMTDALIASLAKLRALRTISRTSAMHYKGSTNTLPEIAQELDVDAVVEGSVLRIGDSVRITIQLIRADTDTQLWAENYERDVEDVLLLQGEVAQVVAQKIQVAVTPQEKKILASARKVNPQAYEAYLKGRYYSYKVTPENAEKALQYFNLALEKDPDYAPAYAGIGDIWGARAFQGLAPPQQAFSLGKPAALKAVELDDHLAEGHEILARFKMALEWDWAAAETESQHAMALDPHNPNVGFAHWWFLLITKRFAEATKQAEQSLRLDPFNVSFQALLGFQLLWEGRCDDAIGQFRKALASAPDLPWALQGLLSCVNQKNETENTLMTAQQYLMLIGHQEIAEAMDGHQAAHSYEEVMSHGAEQLVNQAQLRYVPMLLIARFYAYAKEKGLALDWLEKACEAREPQAAFLTVDADWDILREEPGFTTLLDRFSGDLG